jgi:hypothetical protein
MTENNRNSRAKQKEYYDQGTKLRQFETVNLVVYMLRKLLLGKIKAQTFCSDGKDHL